MPLSGRRILVVDDDVLILRLVREAAGGLLGCEVDTTPSPQQGFEMVLKRDYDLLIIDFSMPGIDGSVLYDLLRRVFMVHPPTGRKLPPVLLMSGNASHQNAQALLREPGIRGLLAKPFSLERMSGKLVEVLGAS